MVHVPDQKVGVAELVGDVPHRHVRADEAAGVDDRLERRRLGDAEGEDVFGMSMDHGVHVGARLIDRGVDEPLQVKRARLAAHRLAVEAQFHDVAALDQIGSERAREKEMLRLVRVPDADVAVGIHHVFLGEDAVGDHEVLDDGVEAAHGSVILAEAIRIADAE